MKHYSSVLHSVGTRRHADTPTRRHADTPTRRHADTPTRRHAALVILLFLLSAFIVNLDAQTNQASIYMGVYVRNTMISTNTNHINPLRPVDPSIDIVPECETISFIVFFDNLTNNTLPATSTISVPKGFFVEDAGSYELTGSNQNYNIYTLEDRFQIPVPIPGQDLFFETAISGYWPANFNPLEPAVFFIMTSTAGNTNASISGNFLAPTSCLITGGSATTSLYPPGTICGGDYLVLETDLIVDDYREFDADDNTPGSFLHSIYAKPDKKIIIENGGTLDLTGFELFPCEGSRWGGIEVESGGTLILDNCLLRGATTGITIHPDGSVELEDTRLNDNTIGIDIPDDGTAAAAASLSLSGTTIQGTEVYENYDPVPNTTPEELRVPEVGMRISKPGNYTIKPTIDYWNNSFKNILTGIDCEGDINLDVTFADFEDMGRVENSTSAIFGGHGIRYFGSGSSVLNVGIPVSVTFGTPNRSVYFNNCIQAAISAAEAASVNVVYSLMEDCHTGVGMYSVRSCDVNNNVINTARHAIILANPAAFNLGISTRFYIEKNVMQDVYLYGIYVKKDYGITTIRDNTVEVGGDSENSKGILLDGWSPFRQYDYNRVSSNTIFAKTAKNGIFMNNRHINWITQNTVLLEGLGSSPAGIELVNTGAFALCNDISATGNIVDSDAILETGGYFSNMSCNSLDVTEHGIRFGDITSQSTVKGNTFGDHEQHGIQLNVLDGSVFTVIGEQILHGNLWTKDQFATNQKGAIHYGAVEEIQASKFEVNNTALQFPPVSTPNIPSSTQWFVPNGGTAFECEDDQFIQVNCNGNVGDPDFTPPQVEFFNAPIYTEVAKDLFINADYGSDLTWKLQRRLYRNLNETATASWSSTGHLDSFYTEQQDSAVGSYQQTEDLITSSYSTVASNAAVLESNLSQADSLRNILVGIDTSIQQTSDSATLVTLTASYIDINAQIQAIMQDVHAANTATHSAVMDDIPTLAASVSSLSATLTPQQNEKDVIAAYLSLSLSDSIEIDSTTRASLTAVAIQCPLSGGDAVYWARAMLSDTIVYDDPTTCRAYIIANNAASDEVEEQQKQLSFTIAPNPAMDDVNVYISKKRETSTRLDIFNNMGVRLRSLDLGAATFTSQNISELPSGMYFLILTDSEGHSFSRKLSVSK